MLRCCCAALQARPLTVEDDMQPVVGFFVQQGLSTQQIVQVRLTYIHSTWPALQLAGKQ